MEAKCMARGTAGAGERRVQEKRRVQGNGACRGTAGAGGRRVQTSSIRIGTVGFGVFAKTHGKLSATSPHFLPSVIAISSKPTVCVAPYRPISYRG